MRCGYRPGLAGTKTNNREFRSDTGLSWSAVLQDMILCPGPSIYAGPDKSALLWRHAGDSERQSTLCMSGSQQSTQRLPIAVIEH